MCVRFLSRLHSGTTYPFALHHDHAHVLPDGAHDVEAHVHHLQVLREPRDQHRVVLRLGEQPPDHPLETQRQHGVT